jgi:mono/diheme cytochrome c family protein
MRTGLTLLLIPALLMTGAITLPSALAQNCPALLKRGAALLGTNCGRCHAIGTAGLSPHASAPPFRTLSRKYSIDGLQEALGEGISVGHPDMPEFTFDPEDIGAILAYLKSIQEH